MNEIGVLDVLKNKSGYTSKYSIGAGSTLMDKIKFAIRLKIEQEVLPMLDKTVIVQAKRRSETIYTEIDEEMKRTSF